MKTAELEWDSKKNQINIEKHGVDFYDAQQAFLDKKRIIAEDFEHGHGEKRYFCFGKVSGRVITVRFTWRNNIIQDHRCRLLEKRKKYI